MKKILTIVWAVFVTSQLVAQAGRVRVTFLGFKCYRETWDDILGLDGHGDELLFKFNISTADQAGNTKFNYDRVTDVYGDKSGAYTNRIKAGTETPNGGVRAGDLVNTNLLLGEYDLSNGDFVTVVPTAWEQDPIADDMNSFASTVAGVASQVNKTLAPVMIGLHLATGDLAGALFHGGMLRISATRPAGDQGELGKAGTRPIGMKKYGDYTPDVVAVNTANLSTLCNSNFGWGNGIVEVKYDEVALGNTRDHGIYSILLKFEFTPVANAAPAPAPASKSTVAAPAPAGNTAASTTAVPAKSTTLSAPRAVASTKTISTAKPVLASGTTASLPAAPATSLTYDLASGLWRGTMNTSGTTAAAPLNLRLDSHTFWVLKNDGTTAATAAGTFAVEKGVMTAKYTSNGISFTYTSTGFNQSTLEMSGTWSGGGKTGTWIVKKIGG